MSDHSHDSHDSHGHASHDDHGHGHDDHGDHGHGGHDDHSHGHDDHGQGGHDDHGHGHEHYGDYNAKPLPPSTLPPVNPLWLSVFGLALSALLAAIVIYSIGLSERTHQVHGEDSHGAPHTKHDDSHTEKDAHGKH
jgi:hypothetical protein